MSYLVEVPVDGDARLVVQVAEDDLPGGDLELAAVRPGEIVARAGETLDEALDRIRPALRAVRNRLAALGPDEIELEFGIVLGTEAGVVIAKGTTEVHFTVTLKWSSRRAPAVDDGH